MAELFPPSQGEGVAVDVGVVGILPAQDGGPARAAQGKVEVTLVNSTPLLVTMFLKAGLSFSVPGNWSSVRTKMMLGRSTLGPSMLPSR
jgi:hypothetical protein